jgi:hypothetical protein
LGTTKHTAKLVLTLQANGSLLVSGSLDGNTASGTKAAPLLTTTFNELAFSNSSSASANTFAIDNLTVTTNNPPRITITAPSSGIVWSTSAASLALSGTASDDVAVTQVTWTKNGGGSGTATGTSAWSISAVPLVVGVNVITVSAANAAGYTGTATFTVTRTQPGTLQFSSSAYALDEIAGIASIYVTRTGGSDGAVSVNWQTSNGTAAAGVDYTARSGTLTWANGTTATKLITVPLLAGSMSSGDSMFNLGLSSPSVAGTLGSPSTAVVTIHHAPTDHWRFKHFGANANNAAVSGDLVSLAGDGIVNLLKYELHLDPLVNGRAGMPTVSQVGGNLVLTFTRDLSATDVVYQAQWSDDLGAWSANGVTISTTPIDAATEQVKASVPVSADGQRFMRLQVMRP